MIIINKLRTDLALEAHEINNERGKKDGIIVNEKEVNGIKITIAEIKEGEGEELTGKKAGIYTTVDIGEIWKQERDEFNNTAQTLAGVIKSLMPKEDEEKCVLVAGLGNVNITSDAIGPRTVEKIIVTRHIRSLSREIYESVGFGSIAALSPGVLGQTGIETAEIIRSVAEKISPYCVIVIDALAARKLSRLATTVQLSDQGIRPGSGISNHRLELCRETLGIPVIAIGIPTVVDAGTLAYDLIEELSKGLGTQAEEGVPDSIIEKLISGDGNSMFVTPKESDVIIKETSRLIATAINLALHKGIPIEEMEEYIR